MTTNRRTFLKHLAAGAGWASCSFPPLWAEEEPAFPRSTPEAEGIDSAGILAFLEALAPGGHEFHSLMIARHGRIVAEGWWDPYKPGLPHTLNSLSKSFTSMAVGFAVAEKKLTLEDSVIAFFPEARPKTVSSHLAALKVKHLLTMSVGHASEPTNTVTAGPDWVKAFLAYPIPHPPGEVFLYNSSSSYMCSAIVQAVTGQRIVDYLQPRLFQPLGIDPPSWEVSPQGINTGGWGLNLPTEALARFGQTLLQRGRWSGRQVIPSGWVAAATAFQIQQGPDTKPGRPRAENDWQQGYGYQFWRCRHGAYRGDGALGQYVVVFPEKDTVVAITGESADMQGELDLVWKHLLPALRESPLPDSAAAARLRGTLSALALAPPRSAPLPAPAKHFVLEPNSLGLGSIHFEWSGSVCRVTMSNARAHAAHTVPVGLGHWEKSRSALPWVPPRVIAGGAPPAGTEYAIAAAGRWKGPEVFEMVWRYYEMPQFDTIACSFQGSSLAITFTPSLGRGVSRRPRLQGRLV